MRFSLVLLVAGCSFGVDADGDGVTVGQGDCDDADPTIGPGVDEWCDGVDEDCDGVVDNDARDEGTYFVDQDGDGFGSAEHPMLACDRGDLVISSSDCDDSDPKVNPAADDTDNKDRDCDGVVGSDAEGRWVGDCEPLAYTSFGMHLELDVRDNDGNLRGDGTLAAIDPYGTYTAFYAAVEVDGVREGDDVDFGLNLPDDGLYVGPFVGSIDGDEMALDYAGSSCLLERD
jgi:hypothetical protein